MATQVKKSAKINLYKFVSPVKATSKSEDVALIKAQNSTTSAVNNLGKTLNSLAKVLTEFRDNQISLLKSFEATAPKKFVPKFNQAEQKGPFVKEEAEQGQNTKAPSWLEAIFNLVKDFIQLAVVGPALAWLSDPANRQTIVNTLETIGKIFEIIGGFVTDRMKDAIDGLYDFFREDSSWWEKLTGFFKGFGNFALLMIGLRWITSPAKMVKDVGKVINTFWNVLKALGTGLTKRGLGGGKLPPGPRPRGGLRKGLATTALLVGGGLAVNYAMNRGGGKGEGEGEGEDEGFSKGGRLPKRAGGGWINGPMSGYPVSLDGGRSTSFIGHGTEYVAPAKSGGGYVIPVNTPATKNNPGLTDRRINEASRMGFDLGGLLGRGKTDPSNDHKMKKMAAGGKMPSVTSNGGGNRRMELGKRYKWSDLAPHHSNEGQIRTYGGIPIGHPKDYGIGVHPNFMPSGPNGRIITPQSGKVIFNDDTATAQGYGNTVVIKGPLGHMQFSHMQKKSKVRVGQQVSKGTVLGLQGTTGSSTAEHLHLNATKKGHEAYVNYHTLGRARTSSTDSGSSYTGTGNLSGSVNQKSGQLAAFFKRKWSLKKFQAAAIVGTLRKEGFAGGHPDVREGGARGAPTYNGTRKQGYGWVQWTNTQGGGPNDRLNRALIHLGMQNNPRPWTDADNIKVMDWEIKKYYPTLLPELKKTNNIADAVRTYVGIFEAGGMSQIPRYERQEGGGFIQRRVKEAKIVMDNMDGASDTLSLDGGDTDSMGDDQHMEPMPKDPMEALSSLQSGLLSAFGIDSAQSTSSPSTAAADSKKGNKSGTTGQGTDKLGPAHMRPGQGAGTPGAGAAGDSKSDTKPGSAASASTIGGTSPPSAIPPAASRSGASAASPTGSTSSSSLVTQTGNTLKAKQAKQRAANQNLAAVAAVAAQQNQKVQALAAATAQPTPQGKQSKPKVVATGGGGGRDLISQLNSTNNPMRSNF